MEKMRDNEGKWGGLRLVLKLVLEYRQSPHANQCQPCCVPPTPREISFLAPEKFCQHVCAQRRHQRLWRTAPFSPIDSLSAMETVHTG